MIKNVFENVTTTQNAEEVKLDSNYLNDDGKNLINASSKINISDSQYSLYEGSFLNNYLNNLTIISSIANKTHSPERTKSGIPNSKEINQQSTINDIKIINHMAETRINSSDFEKNAFTDSINDGTDDFGKFLKNRRGEEKLEVTAQKISRLGMNDGQSKDAEKEFPWGNTSRVFGIATNELWSCVETTGAVRENGIDGTRKQNCGPIPGVIKVFEPRGRPYQKQEAKTRLSRRMGKGGMSVAGMKMNEDEIDKSRNTNAREDSSTSPIDSVIDATMKPETAYINTSETGESIVLKDPISVTVDNDLRKQQQMVPAENRNANKSNGNLDIDRINIRILGSNGNESMNVKEGTRTIMEPHEYHKSDNNLHRKLLWISTISAEADETEDSSIKSTRSVFNTTIENGIENVTNRQQSEISGPNLRKALTRVDHQDTIKESRALQDLNSQISETNHYARYKRSICPYESTEFNNEADSENTAVEKETAINHDEKREDNEDNLDQNVEKSKESYNDREENIFEGISLI